MNKTQQLLKEREKEFNEKFGSVNGDYFRDFDTPTKVKAHITTTISLLLNSLKEEMSGPIFVSKWLRNKYGLNDEDTLTAEEVEELVENFRDDISTLLSQTISNIQTK